MYTTEEDLVVVVVVVDALRMDDDGREGRKACACSMRSTTTPTPKMVAFMLPTNNHTFSFPAEEKTTQ